tara:strand:- start:9 stop:644 length:636 start_codon:yes stop_codon:yes gene_type:complete
MNKITKRSFYVFWMPIIGYWALLITIYFQKDFENFKLIPSLLYFVASALTVYNIQDLISGSESDPIIKVSKTRALLISLAISSIAIFLDFLLFPASNNVLTSIVIVISTVVSFFTTGLFEYSNEQLEEKFLERSSERNFSIESRDSWDLFLDEIEEKFNKSSKVQNEILRIRKILPYSSFFRSDKSKTILGQVRNISNEDNLLSTLKKYVK